MSDRLDFGRSRHIHSAVHRFACKCRVELGFRNCADLRYFWMDTFVGSRNLQHDCKHDRMPFQMQNQLLLGQLDQSVHQCQNEHFLRNASGECRVEHGQQHYADLHDGRRMGSCSDAEPQRHTEYRGMPLQMQVDPHLERQRMRQHEDRKLPGTSVRRGLQHGFEHHAELDSGRRMAALQRADIQHHSGYERVPLQMQHALHLDEQFLLQSRLQFR